MQGGASRNGHVAAEHHKYVLGGLEHQGRREPVCLRATKAAVIGLTKAIAPTTSPKRALQCDLPSTVRTPSLGERVAALGGDQDAVWKSFVDRQPWSPGRADEIAALAVYLASDESSFTTAPSTSSTVGGQTKNSEDRPIKLLRYGGLGREQPGCSTGKACCAIYRPWSPILRNGIEYRGLESCEHSTLIPCQ